MAPLIWLLLGTIGVAAVVATRATAARHDIVPPGSNIVPGYAVNPALFGQMPFAMTPPLPSAKTNAMEPVEDLSGFLQRAFERIRRSTERQMMDNNTRIFFTAVPDLGGMPAYYGSGGVNVFADVAVQTALSPTLNPLIVSNPVSLETFVSRSGGGSPFNPADFAGDFAGYLPPLLQTSHDGSGDSGHTDANPPGGKDTPSSPSAPSAPAAPSAPDPNTAFSTDLFSDPTIADMMGDSGRGGGSSAGGSLNDLQSFNDPTTGQTPGFGTGESFGGLGSWGGGNDDGGAGSGGASGGTAP